jgi:hypothetical protein
MLEPRNDLLAERGSGPLAQVSSLKRVRTINRLQSCHTGMQKSSYCREDFTVALPLTGAVHASTLKRVRTMTGRRSVVDSDGDSLVVAL